MDPTSTHSAPPLPSPVAARAVALDAEHRAAYRREAFVIPDGTIYLDGNSLGALPKAVPAAVAQVIEHEWGQRLIRSWNEADWWGAQTRVGDTVGRLVGAAAGQVVVSDSTSVNLFKVVVGAARMRPDRHVVLIDPDSFPTDLYITHSAARLVGAEVRLVPPAEAAAVIREVGDDLALASYSSVDYRTGERWDLEAITAASHEVGALACWDLCHSAGAMDVELDSGGADFAVGCGYKYLNGGPGAPAFLYVAARHLSGFEQPLTGWHGHARPFEMGPDYHPAPGITRGRVGTPPLLSLLALEAALTAYDGLPLADVRGRSLSLTRFFVECLDGLGLGDAVVTPRDDARRGSQVAVRHPQAYAVVQALMAHGVIADFREPDLVRLGFAPLYVSHEDAAAAASILAQVVHEQEYARDEFRSRATVT